MGSMIGWKHRGMISLYYNQLEPIKDDSAASMLYLKQAGEGYTRRMNDGMVTHAYSDEKNNSIKSKIMAGSKFIVVMHKGTVRDR